MFEDKDPLDNPIDGNNTAHDGNNTAHDENNTALDENNSALDENNSTLGENNTTPEPSAVNGSSDVGAGVNPVDELPEIPVAPVIDVPAPAIPPRAAGPKGTGWKLFAAAVALVAVGAGVGSATTYSLAGSSKAGTPIGGYTQPIQSAKTVSGGAAVVAGDNVIPEVYRRVSPAVVTIDVKVTGRYTRGSATGSGFVVDPKGYILTNNHVVEGGSTITVSFVDGTTLDAKVVGTDKYKDLALLQVNPGNRSLVAAALGNSDNVVVGELAIAIGSPLGNNHSVTSGIISALNREIVEDTVSVRIPGALQTDASINPGNSGGPLLNASGEVVGINTAIETPNGRGSVGIGFAIPINAAKDILPTLLAGQSVKYPWIGVSVGSMTKDIAQQLGTTTTEGAVVSDVVKGSPAEKAGIRQPRIDQNGQFFTADIITAINGKAVKTADDVINTVKTYKVGDTVTVTVVRSNKPIDLKVTLELKPDPSVLSQSQSQNNPPGN